MANTEGGVVLLGSEESEADKFTISGISDPAKVQKELWSGLRNRQQISCNILQDSDVSVADVDGKQLIRVRIPRATRFQMPV